MHLYFPELCVITTTSVYPKKLYVFPILICNYPLTMFCESCSVLESGIVAIVVTYQPYAWAFLHLRLLAIDTKYISEVGVVNYCISFLVYIYTSV